MHNSRAIALVLALVVFGAVVSREHQGLTVPSHTGANRQTELIRENVVSVSRYQVSGDRKGKVTVKDTVSGDIIRTFQMDSGVVVREVLLLDGGTTVAASQKDHAVFWDLATGKEIGRVNQRIYGFSHDEKKFFTQNLEGIFLYTYPDLTHKCKLTNGPLAGTEVFHFSPDDRFLGIEFHTGFPSSDENYPDSNPTPHGLTDTKLFNLQTCQEIQEFSALRVYSLGEFSSDGKFYDLKNTSIVLGDGNWSTGSWRFNLRTYQVEKLSE